MNHHIPPSPPKWQSRLPTALSTRVKEDELHILLLIDVKAFPQLKSIEDHLRRLSPLPLRITTTQPKALMQGQFSHCKPGTKAHIRLLTQAKAALVDIADTLLHSLLSKSEPDSKAHLKLLTQAEAALIHAEHADKLLPILNTMAIPTLIWNSTECENTPQGGLKVSDATPEQLAELLLLLATDPPTRRGVLAGQGAHPNTAWRMEGLFDSSYSLAIVNRQLALALNDTHQDTNETVHLYTYEQGDDPQPNFNTTEQPERLRSMWLSGQQAPLPPLVALRNAWPPRVRDMRARTRTLANYAWEETTFPAEHAAEFNRVLDLITVVSRQTAQLLQDAGIDVPIVIVGNGVDHLQKLTPTPPPIVLPEGFRFLHISSCFPRKGADVLLRAFGRAFRAQDPVSLIIKTFPNPHNQITQQLQELRQSDPGYPKVELLLDDWPAEQIAGLYAACHTLVAPSRAEGFGLPIAEAMLHGLPVIATGWGGHTDFCNESNAQLTRYTLEPAQTHLGLRDSLWAEPDEEHLTQQLKQAWQQSAQERSEQIARARNTIATYTWANTAQRTRQAVAALARQPAPRPIPRIFWISTWGSRCGIAAYSQHMINAMQKVSITVHAPIDERTETNDPPYVERTWYLGTPAPLHEHIQAKSPDVLIIQHNWGFMEPNALIELIQCAQQNNVEVILEFHNTRSAPDTIRNPDILATLNTCARLLVHTRRDLNNLREWGIDMQKASLLPLAVYPVEIPSAEATQALRKQLQLEGKRLLATFGYLMPHKGLSQMIEAMPEILRAEPKVHLLMLNAYYNHQTSEAEHKQLLQRIRELNLNDHITLDTTYHEETDALARLRLAEWIVFPYQNTEESSSAAVRMGLRALRPIAVTPLPIFEDISQAAQYLPGTSPAHLATGLIELLLHHPAKEQDDPRTRALCEHLDAHRIGKQLSGLVRGILASKALQ